MPRAAIDCSERMGTGGLIRISTPRGGAARPPWLAGPRRAGLGTGRDRVVGRARQRRRMVQRRDQARGSAGHARARHGALQRQDLDGGPEERGRRGDRDPRRQDPRHRPQRTDQGPRQAWDPHDQPARPPGTARADRRPSSRHAERLSLLHADRSTRPGDPSRRGPRRPTQPRPRSCPTDAGSGRPPAAGTWSSSTIRGSSPSTS